MDQLAAWIILLPLSAALLAMALSRVHHLSRDVIFVALSAAFVLSVLLLREVIVHGPVHYAFGGYAMPYGIEFAVDAVGAVIIVLVMLLGVLSFFFSLPFSWPKSDQQVASIYAMRTLLVVGLTGMAATGDVFNLYVFLEISSLSGYCMIALGGSRGVVAAFRYLLVGTVAATFYLLGVAILYGATGTLNMADMRDLLDGGGHDTAMLVALCLLVAAFCIKMALFPFHGWQPAAYAHAATTSRPLIAGAMSKLPALAMFRYFYCIYGTDFKYFRVFLILIGVLSVGSMLYGSLRAMAQTDVRKMLAYSSVAQIGYISLGFAVGTPIALAGAFLHMLGHAFMKSGLFFASGAIRYKYGTVRLEDFGRIYKDMPLVSGLLTIAALSMVGIPPTVGFFSKWYLAVGAAGAGSYVYVAVLVISSLLNAVYFFKLIEKVFIQEKKERKEQAPKSRAELPWTMLVPVAVCFLAILLLGVFNVPVMEVLLSSIEGVAL